MNQCSACRSFFDYKRRRGKCMTCYLKERKSELEGNEEDELSANMTDEQLDMLVESLRPTMPVEADQPRSEQPPFAVRNAIRL
jgi:hypothetical protein